MSQFYILFLSTLTLLAITSCGASSSSQSDVIGVSSVAFSPIDISKNDSEKQSMRVSEKITVSYTDNSTKEYALKYNTLAKMGDTIGSGRLGLITDINNSAILLPDNSEYVSQNPDGNSLINVADKTYLITHMEGVPGELYHTELELQNGVVVGVQTKPVDLSSINGTVVNCASSTTKYGSHLGGEEDYSLNSIFADINSPFYVNCALNGLATDTNGVPNYFCAYVDAMRLYLKENNIDKNSGYNGDTFSPYNYGYIVEVQPQSDGSNRVAKHYTTGKYTPELAVMLPDAKTVYMTDDGTAKGLWKFVSDEKITDFKTDWQGRLYAPKLQQTAAQNGGTFTLSWIELGHAKDSEIKAFIDSKMKLTDIFQIQKPDLNATCADGFRLVYEDATLECLKLQDGKEKEAAFLETRKYAAYLGATVEFRKEEGLTFDADSNSLYVAMSEISASMEDNYKGYEPTNDIKLAKNLCGGVYKLALDENYSATSMEAIVVGLPLNVGEPYADEWACSPHTIANPDNITYIGHNTLLISEDSTNHVNNMTWAYNTQDKTLTRIVSLPIGAEITGVNVGFIKDKGLLLINTQHPFVDNPKAADGSKPNAALITNATDEQKKAEIGYIDGIPATIFE